MLTIEKENINVETILKDAWIKYEIGQGYIEDIQDAFTQLENLELDKLDIKPFEVEAILDIRRQGE